MIKTDSTYSRKLFSFLLTGKKFRETIKVALMKRKLKNMCSMYVYHNLDEFVFGTYTKQSFSIKMYSEVFTEEVRKQNGIYLSVALIDAAFQEVFMNYKAKFNAIKKKLKFSYKGIFDGFEFYQRDSKKHKKGEVKKSKHKIPGEDKQEKKQNKIRIAEFNAALTYISRYGNKNIVEYIHSVYDEAEEDKKKFYDVVLRYILKFSLERLLKAAELNKLRVYQKYRKPVVYEKLTFNGFSRQKELIVNNKNKNSKIEKFISLTWVEHGKPMYVPIKWNNEFYGSIEDYNETSYAYRYKVKPVKTTRYISDDDILTDGEVDKKKLNRVISKKDLQICVIVATKGERYYPDASLDYDDMIGIDVNIKHNAMMLDDGMSFDWDRDIILKLLRVYKEIDERSKKDKDYKPGKKVQKKLDALRNACDIHRIKMCTEVARYIQFQGKHHAVFENVDNQFKKTFVTMDDVNINRIMKDLGIGNLKNDFEHIGRNYDIATSIVPSEYTSQLCTECWTIDEDNRQIQEEFKCVHCNAEMQNADLHGANTIKIYASNTVFRDALLKENEIGNGSFLPKDLTHTQVKGKIQDCVRRLSKQQQREDKAISNQIE